MIRTRDCCCWWRCWWSILHCCVLVDVASPRNECRIVWAHVMTSNALITFRELPMKSCSWIHVQVDTYTCWPLNITPAATLLRLTFRPSANVNVNFSVYILARVIWLKRAGSFSLQKGRRSKTATYFLCFVYHVQFGCIQLREPCPVLCRLTSVLLVFSSARWYDHGGWRYTSCVPRGPKYFNVLFAYQATWTSYK